MSDIEGESVIQGECRLFWRLVRELRRAESMTPAQLDDALLDLELIRDMTENRLLRVRCSVILDRHADARPGATA